MNINSESLLVFFCKLAPEFESVWNSDKNYNIEDDGSFTLCGVCMEFALYIEDQEMFKDDFEGTIEPDWRKNISAENLKILFDFIENEIVKDSHEGDVFKGCFLESLACTPASYLVKKYGGEKSLCFFRKWHVEK